MSAEGPSKEQAGAASTAEIVGKLVGLLHPLAADERRRVIQACLILLGDSGAAPLGSAQAKADVDPVNSGVPKRVAIWMQHNGVSEGQIEQVFTCSRAKPT